LAREKRTETVRDEAPFVVSFKAEEDDDEECSTAVDG